LGHCSTWPVTAEGMCYIENPNCPLAQTYRIDA
jgi:hypothetical protein